MRGGKMAKLALLCGIALVGAGGAALAQNPVSGFMQHYFGHIKPSKGSACPGLTVVMQSMPTATDIAGYAFFDNAMGISKIAGMRAPDGSFTATLTSIDGDGPAGTAAGKRAKDGTINGAVNINGCPSISLAPMKPYYAPQGNN